MKNKNLKIALMKLNEDLKIESSEFEIINPSQSLLLKGGCGTFTCGTYCAIKCGADCGLNTGLIAQ